MNGYMRDFLRILKRRWMLAVGGILVYCTLFQAFYNLLKYDTAVPYTCIGDFLVSYTYNLIPILLVILLNVLVVFVIPRRHNIKFAVKMLGDMLLSGAIFFVIGKAFLLVGGTFNPDIRIDWVGAGLNAILVFLIVQLAYWQISTRKSMLKAQEEQKKALQYRYDVLKAQVNPHFLFNSLNILYSLIGIDPSKSRQFTLQLSSMYRHMLMWQDKDTVPMEEETEFLKSYIAVLEMRYRGQFRVVMSGEAGGGRRIVPHTLQILVENVTKHNIISSACPMTVRVNFGGESVSVSNHVNRKLSSTSTELGIRYISELYQSMGKTVSVRNTGGVFSVEVPYL